MSTIRQEGAENPELSLKADRRAMLQSAVLTGCNSMFGYYGYATLDEDGLKERGIAYPRPQHHVAPVMPMQHVVMAPQPMMRPAQHTEQPPVAEQPIVSERPIEPAPIVPMQPAEQPVQPAAAQLAPTPTIDFAPVSTPEIPAQESAHMTDARAKVEAAFAEMQLETQQPMESVEQSAATHREDYGLAA